MTTEYRDMMGQEIKVGDYIVYAAVDGRSGTLRAGQVLALTTAKEGSYGREPGLKLRVKAWSNFKRCGSTWGGRTNDVTLSFLDRLIVIPESAVSAKIKADLAGEVLSD